MQLLKQKAGNRTMLSINNFSAINANATYLEFSENDRDKAWMEAQNYSNDSARWNAFLNNLCLNTISKWLQEEFDISAPEIWNVPSIWEIVNGAALFFGKTRIVLIPSEALDTKEFCSPQEWVDIKSWVADYYLAVQILTDECQLCIWGFTTHSQLKNQGDYDPTDRTYTLERDDLMQDINAFLVALEMCAVEKATVKSVANLSTAEAEKLLQQLSKPSSYSPRLEVDFENWAALLENETWREQLYKRRISPPVIATVKPMVNLSSWLQNVFEAGWQTVEELFGTQEASLAFRMGNSTSSFRETDTIKTLINQINTSPIEHKRKQAAFKLGKIGAGNKEAIAALINLIRTTDDEETRWTAAESLWMIDPGNPAAGVRRGIDLGMQLAGNAIALLVGILEKAEGKMAVLLQVYAMRNQRSLPPNLQLIVLDDKGNIFRETQARSADAAIQLKFSGLQGEQFTVKVAFGEANITEDFII